MQDKREFYVEGKDHNFLVVYAQADFLGMASTVV